MQRFAMVAFASANRRVTDAPQVAEERSLRRAVDVIASEAVDERLLPVLRSEEKADLRGGALREHVVELAQLQQADARLSGKAPLGLRRERDKPRIV